MISISLVMRNKQLWQMLGAYVDKGRSISGSEMCSDFIKYFPPPESTSLAMSDYARITDIQMIRKENNGARMKSAKL